MLRIKNLKKLYGSQVALQIKDVEIGEGVYWVKGQNGSGKSTLLKCLAGLLSFKGEIEFDSNSLKKNPEKYLQSVNYSATEPVYPDFLLGNQLLDFVIKSKAGTYENSESMIQCFGMQDFINSQPIAQYSSGMLKKLSLLLAFAGAPKVILLDEPYITLDLAASALLSDWICQFQKKRGTIIMTSHLDALPFPAKEIELNNGMPINL